MTARRRTKTSSVRQRCGAEERADDDAEGTRKRTFEVDGQVQNRIRSSKQVKNFCSWWSNQKQDQKFQTDKTFLLISVLMRTDITKRFSIRKLKIPKIFEGDCSF